MRALRKDEAIKIARSSNRGEGMGKCLRFETHRSGGEPFLEVQCLKGGCSWWYDTESQACKETTAQHEFVFLCPIVNIRVSDLTNLR
jgi:hypothetical protein